MILKLATHLLVGIISFQRSILAIITTIWRSNHLWKVYKTCLQESTREPYHQGLDILLKNLPLQFNFHRAFVTLRSGSIRGRSEISVNHKTRGTLGMITRPSYSFTFHSSEIHFHEIAAHSSYAVQSVL